MSGEKKPPIIKKIIKKGHGGHHGGSWKVAYADFVTAMMAFFLVMWLLAISSEQGRQSLADYFNELTMTDAVFNGGLPSAFTEGGAKRPGILEGGCFKPQSDGDATVDPETDNEAVAAQMAALLEATQNIIKNLESLPEGTEGGEGSGDAGHSAAEAPGAPGEGGGGGGPLTAEQTDFKREILAQAADALGESAAEQLSVEKVKGGLRIQVMDQDGLPLFKLGGAALTARGQGLFRVVAERLKSLTNKISIEGHTDGLRMPGQKVTNWELSSARASAARIALNQDGLSDSRLTAVTGYAATKPLEGVDPDDPQNRRVSIMIWDDDKSAVPSTMAPAPAAPSMTAPSTAAPSTTAPSTTAPASRPGAPGAGSAPRAGGAVSPPPRPKLPVAQPPSAPLKTRQQLENEMIDDSMQRAATDRSTVGPPLPPPADAE